MRFFSTTGFVSFVRFGGDDNFAVSAARARFLLAGDAAFGLPCMAASSFSHTGAAFSFAAATVFALR